MLYLYSAYKKHVPELVNLNNSLLRICQQPEIISGVRAGFVASRRPSPPGSPGALSAKAMPQALSPTLPEAVAARLPPSRAAR